MKVLRSYDDRAAAELDLDLLRANRIDAVLTDAGGATAGTGARELQLSVPADQHLQALAILTDEAESHAQVTATAQPATATRRTAIALIRGAALFFVVNALLYVAAIGEHLWRGSAAQPAPSDPQRPGVQEDIARMALHALVGGLLLAYAETLAKVICRGPSNRGSGQDGTA